MASKNYIYQDLKTNVENCKLQDKLLQGSTNRTFAFTLFDRGVQSLLDSNAEVTAIVLYEPKFIDGVFSYKGSYVLDKNTQGYDIIIQQETLGGKQFSVVLIPFHEQFVSYAGNCEFILKVSENGIETYTYSMQFVVDRNNAYMPQSLPNNLPMYKDLMLDIENLKSTKANKDLSNISNVDFKNKAKASGSVGFQTGGEIKAELENLPVGSKLNYNNALDGKPTIPVIPTSTQIATGLNALSGDDRVDYKSLKNQPNLPSTGDVVSDLESLTGDSRLDVNALKNVDNLSKKDLSNVSNYSMKTKAELAGVMIADMSNADINALDEKITKTDSGKLIQQTSNDLSNKVSLDLSNLPLDTLSEKIKLTNAYMDLSGRIHPSTTGYTPEQIRAMFEANYFEPSINLDLTQPQYGASTLYIQFNPTSNNQVINQTLPPASKNQIIMVQFTPNSGTTGTSLVISPNGSDHLNGGITPVTITDTGYAGYRYTANSSDTKVPVGIITGGDGKIINDNSWHDAGSDDPNKVQGDYKFLTSGNVRMRYQARCFNEQSTINQVEFWIAKVNADGTFTEVSGSRNATTIEAKRTTKKYVNSVGTVGKKEDGWFEFNVNANDSYRVFMKSDKDDGFYIQSDTNGDPLFRADIIFDEFTADEQDVFNRLNNLEMSSNEVVFVEDGKEVFNKILQYDVKTGKMTVVDKVV